MQYGSDSYCSISTYVSTIYRIHDINNNNKDSFTEKLQHMSRNV